MEQHMQRPFLRRDKQGLCVKSLQDACVAGRGEQGAEWEEEAEPQEMELDSKSTGSHWRVLGRKGIGTGPCVLCGESGEAEPWSRQR